MIRVVIADDEPLAREGALMLLAPEKDVQVVAVCANGEQAVSAIAQHRPDLVLLDIQMPGMTGFDVIRVTGVEHMPRVIFLTAFDRHAVEAFEVHAFDYLLKPVSPERFAEAMSRVRTAIDAEKDVPRQGLRALLEQAGRNTEPRIMIRSSGHVFFLRPAEIISVQAEGDYVSVVTRARAHLVRETMASMEARLQPQGFQRIHRSSLVNLQEVRELVTDENGEYFVVMNDDSRLRLSRSHREALYSRMTEGS